MNSQTRHSFPSCPAADSRPADFAAVLTEAASWFVCSHPFKIQTRLPGGAFS